MENKNLIFTTADGQKVYGSPKPPENMEEISEQNRKREFELAQRLNKNLNRDGKGKEGNIREKRPDVTATIEAPEKQDPQEGTV